MGLQSMYVWLTLYLSFEKLSRKSIDGNLEFCGSVQSEYRATQLVSVISDWWAARRIDLWELYVLPFRVIPSFKDRSFS